MQQSGTGMPLLGRNGPIGGVAGGLQGDGEAEGTTGPRRARNCNRPGVRLDNPLRDGESQAGTVAMASGGLAADLDELVEDVRLIFRRDADAGVLDRYLDEAGVVADRHSDGTSGLSELHCITDQVNQDLLDAFRINYQPR